MPTVLEKCGLELGKPMLAQGALMYFVERSLPIARRVFRIS